MRKLFLSIALLSILLTGCHNHRIPPQGQGGFAEWDYPQLTTDDTWHAENVYPDNLPASFRVAQLRLKHFREGCAYLYFPAFVTQAEHQWNKAVRAFAGNLYNDANSDLRQLNLRLDEIDRRMEIAYGPKGSWQANGCRSTDPTFNCAPCGCTATLGKHGCNDSGARYGCSWQRQSRCNPCDKNEERRKANCGGCGSVVVSAAPEISLTDLGEDFPLTFNENLFDFDEDIVKPKFESYLIAIAKRLRPYPDAGFVLHGHTDSKGSNPYNDDLGMRRAEAVKTILRREGVADNRMEISGFGERRPLNNNSTDVLRALNRRVDIYLTDLTPGSSGHSSENRPSCAYVSQTPVTGRRDATSSNVLHPDIYIPSAEGYTPTEGTERATH